METNELYQEMILEHHKNPRNFRAIDPCTHKAEGYNPLCGDHLHVYLTVTSDGVVQDAAFQGEGCAISRSSASLMTDQIKGKTVDEVRRMFEAFHDMLLKREEGAAGTAGLGKLAVFSGIWQYPSRIKCAALAWHALKGALDQNETVSTE